MNAAALLLSELLHRAGLQTMFFGLGMAIVKVVEGAGYEKAFPLYRNRVNGKPAHAIYAEPSLIYA